MSARDQGGAVWAGGGQHSRDVPEASDFSETVTRVGPQDREGKGIYALGVELEARGERKADLGIRAV